jgi:hypothetical protein
MLLIRSEKHNDELKQIFFENKLKEHTYNTINFTL